MQGYELTDRGKIIIAVMVILIVLVSSTVLAVRAWDETLEDLPQEVDSSNEIQNGVLLESNDFYSDDESGTSESAPSPEPEPVPAPPTTQEPEPASAVDSGDESDETEAHAPPTSGPVGFDRTLGTLNFLFTPDLQEAVDDDTIAMIGDLLTSERNTPDSYILVEIPQLSSDDTAVLVSAIIDAFSVHDVSVRDLAFTTFQPDPGEQTFEIRLSLQVHTTNVTDSDSNSDSNSNSDSDAK